MENQSSKFKKTRRRRKRRDNRKRNSKTTDGNRVFNSSMHGESHEFPSSFTIPSQSNWFWQNYRQVMDWQGRHQVAYWKSRALAVECQNSVLMDYVEKLNSNANENTLQFEDPIEQDEDPTAQDEEPINQFEEYQEEQSDDESLVFEVNEEMLAFLQQSIKHKQEMKELRDAECSQLKAHKLECENVIFSKASNGMLESTLLYGKNAPKVLAMETSMQLSFERFTDRAKPHLWPNIPLNL